MIKESEGNSMSGNEIISPQDIKSRIYTLRGMQVMLDEDLALLYGVETRRINEQVKRNIERFPESFSFKLTEKDVENWKSQIKTINDGSLRSHFAILEKGRGQHRKYLPYAFTEQGVAMLSTVLRSKTAVEMSIQIINAFVAMRRFLLSNAQVFQRLDNLELKQIQTDRKLNQVLDVIESRDIQPKQGIFYDGQVFDAYVFINDLVKSAKESIVLIDNYIDESVLVLFSARGDGVR